ncbi:nuclease [Streptomyces racemochromogenes]|uniref:Nuclease n=1 Tax=Streptomyces racemochromogenes TaxID=67353 RepID=A0ABW7PJI9_9ACTN
MSMPMLLITGTFRAKGLKPDGDTVSFTPDHVDDWKLVPGVRPVVPKWDGSASIRLEGIDALETHYGDKDSPLGIQHQPLGLAHEAADALLGLIGFTDFHRPVIPPGQEHRPEDEKITSTIPEVTHGYILTRGADVFGRCVALVGTDFQPAPNGYRVEVDEQMLRNTANYKLMEAGLVYPTYYSEFPELLRASLTAAAPAAATHDPKKGVWARDATTAPSGVKIADLSSLTDDATGAVILPKLFRRLKDYLDLNPSNASLACFRAYLAGASDDQYYLQGKPKVYRGMHHIVEVDGDTVRMTHGPEEIVFVEK